MEFQFRDVKFMSAEEKQRVLHQWELFLKSECKEECFTKLLYHHLINHCSFIAHYNLQSFYETYFVEGEDMVRFLSQFDNSKGIPQSIEYGMTYWITDKDYSDINVAMCQVARKYILQLAVKAISRQREADKLRARALLSKRGNLLRWLKTKESDASE